VVKHPFARALKAANLGKLRFHDLRHTFASQLASRGVSIAVIQKLLGHADIQTTMRYAKLSPDAGIDAVELLTAA